VYILQQTTYWLGSAVWHPSIPLLPNCFRQPRLQLASWRVDDWETVNLFKSENSAVSVLAILVVVADWDRWYLILFIENHWFIVTTACKMRNYSNLYHLACINGTPLMGRRTWGDYWTRFVFGENTDIRTVFMRLNYINRSAWKASSVVASVCSCQYFYHWNWI
jgi:hypothetical protein